MKQKNIFPNLAAELTRAGLDVKNIAAATGKSKGAVYFKLHGINDFTLSEMEQIKNMLETVNASNLTLDYLFARGE